jgi:hypothetical protein
MKSHQTFSPVVLVGAFLLLGFIIFFYIYTNGNFSTPGNTDIRSKAAQMTCEQKCSPNRVCKNLTGIAKSQCLTKCLTDCRNTGVTPIPTLSNGSDISPIPTFSKNMLTPEPFHRNPITDPVVDSQ